MSSSLMYSTLTAAWVGKTLSRTSTFLKRAAMHVLMNTLSSCLPPVCVGVARVWASALSNASTARPQAVSLSMPFSAPGTSFMSPNKTKGSPEKVANSSAAAL
eukprot:1984214-Amphidinium_carterae.3